MFYCRLFLLLVVSCALGCSSGTEGPDQKVIVSYKDKQLTLGALKSRMPDHLPKIDSARIAGLLIDEWVKEQVLAEQALQKVPDIEQKIDLKLQQYKNQLMIVELQKALSNEVKNDTLSDEKLKDYYEKNKNTFVASQPYYKFYFVKTDRQDTPEIRQRLASKDPQNIQTVKEWCEKNKVYHVFSEEWMDAQTFKKKVQSQNPTRNYTNLKPTGLVDFSVIYYPKPMFFFYYVIDYLPAGEPLPFEMVKDKIYETFKHQSGHNDFEQYANQLLQKVKESNEVKIW